MRRSRSVVRALGSVVLSLLLGAAACSSVLVTVQHDEAADFSGYRTYRWSEEPRPATGNPIVDDNALMDRRVRAVVDLALATRGLQLVTGGPADLTIHYHALLERKSAVLTTRDYEAYAGTEVLRAEHTEITEFTEGTLLLDMHDSEREELVWRGVARDSVDDLMGKPNKAEKTLRHAIARMLKDFPPGR